MKTNILAVCLAFVALCGCGRTASGFEPTGTVQQSLGPCNVAGLYMGTGTVTRNDGGGVQCSQNTIGTVNNIGVNFDESGVFVDWDGSGRFPLGCTSVYAGCSVHVECSLPQNPNSVGEMNLTYDLTFDPMGDTATGTYTLRGTGNYCTAFDEDLAFTRQ